MKKPVSVASLVEFGRVRLSKSFFMRDFLFSDIATIHGLPNVPDDPDLAIAAGKKLCTELLEPIQDTFGRIAIRSAFRSSEVNRFGNERQKAGAAGYNCAANDKNQAGHIWDVRDAAGRMGATACIVVPSFWDRFQAEGDWRRMAWWVHDHLPYSEMEFFPRYWAFNITWREEPQRRIFSFCTPKGVLIKPGMANFEGSHRDAWQPLLGESG